MPVRRSDVARRAGTSPAVVSYVLNDGPRRVAPATRARVLAAIEELGYRPDPVARSLRLRRTHLLGLVLPDLADPVFARLARAVEDAALSAGYRVLVGSSAEEGQRHHRYIQDFVDRRADGLIIVPPGAGRSAAVPEGVEVPWVALGRPLGSHAAVRIDDAEAAYQATRHLLDHGRRMVACVAGPAGSATARERVDGWRRACAEADAEAGLHEVGADPRATYDRARRVLAEDTRIDAVFAATDQQAIAVLRALADLGLACPDEIAVAAVDGLPEAGYVVPSLTTVAQPFDDLGRTAVERLLGRIEGGPAGKHRSDRPSDPAAGSGDALLPAVLVPRESCGCVMRVQHA